jgi:hypothetical protein
MARMNDHWIDVALFILASPVLAFLAVRRARERYSFFRLAMEPAFECKCGSPVSLVGQWKCSCGFTYRGHLLRPCPVCESIPCVARCYRCGVTTKLPEAA